MYKFNIPTQHKSIIKVIGIGGGGSNAINHMYNRGIKDVEFVVCNTDAQALNASPVPIKLQIGITLTEGLGAGANPERGKEAALESKEDIRELLSDNTKMVFITAGMGGGTGTGAAPVIAQIARDLEILTVGIVTAPFSFEGKRQIDQALAGIRELRKFCDTVLVVSNDKLREIFGNMTMSQAYAQADNILATAAKSIAELITVQAYVNVDFEDVKTVMRNSGTAVMGSAKVEGENRALKAVEEALASPLLNNKDIKGAQKILLSVMSGDQSELQMDEFGEITEYVRSKAGEDAEFIYGNGVDPTLGEAIRVTVIATGFGATENAKEEKTKHKKVVKDIDEQILRIEEEEQEQREFILEPTVKTKEAKKEPVKKEKEEEDYLEEEESTDIHIVYKNDTKEEDTDAAEQEEEAKINELEQKKLKLMQQAEERAKKLKQLSSNYTDDSEEIKEKLDVPAYLRKNVKFKDIPHSSEKKLSKFNLNDEDQILKNNKFFHDKPD